VLRVSLTSLRRRRGRTLAGGVVLAVATLGLAACGSDSDDSGSGSDAGSGEGATIQHAFGETTVPEDPQRIVTWGWGAPDAVLALGEVPVAMPKLSYGANEEGLMPWLAEELEAMGEETPQMLTDGDEPPLGEILDAEPDLILAPYSGLTEKQYDDLSEIAATVPYPETPWATPWRDVIEITGQALGKEDEAADVILDIEQEVAAAAEAHPEFEGKTIAAVAADPTTNYIYTVDDPRVEFLADLGFTIAPSVEELYNGDVSFFYTLSSEELDKLTSDVLLEYHADEAAAEEFNSRPGVQAMPQSKSGAVAEIVGADLVSSVSPPTALSLSWGLEEYVAELAEATAKAS
jgi:iron complex transport system substrate-binding protein